MYSIGVKVLLQVQRQRSATTVRCGADKKGFPPTLSPSAPIGSMFQRKTYPQFTSKNSLFVNLTYCPQVRYSLGFLTWQI
ncbi:hypothetical protein RRG08_047972 [Elysia crispata]|uniref:Uncharacterized protein n=1 Tax=Elysia crispata TaxID=231223 RepID=A0AAE1DM91_9GAST|nr:hypothetical protein RRG08_047972 [Elysia crispata]